MRRPRLVLGGLSAPSLVVLTTVALVASTGAAAQAVDAEGREGNVTLDAPADGPIEVLVTDFDVAPGLALDAATAREAVAGRLRTIPSAVTVRSLGEVKTTLDKAALSQMLGGDASADLETVSSYVEADRIVYGRVAQVGGVVDVTLRLFNVREGVMELSLGRRVKASEPGLLLTALDGLADRLLAYVIAAYTDGAPSHEYQRLAAKKVKLTVKKKPGLVEEPSPAAARASTMGLGTFAGLTLVGVGATGLAIGGVLLPDAALTGGLDQRDAATLAIPVGMLAIGGVTLVAGAALMILDAME